MSPTTITLKIHLHGGCITISHLYDKQNNSQSNIRAKEKAEEIFSNFMFWYFRSDAQIFNDHIADHYLYLNRALIGGIEIY